jgi:CRISPR-associated endonuclease/helicase Cas3
MIVPTEESGPAVCFERTYYAHSLPDHPIEHWQRLDGHLNQVAARASQFAQEFHSSVWAWNAGLLHDLGKALDGFQAYLRRENHIDDVEYDETGRERVNHSSAGAALAEEFFNKQNKPFGRILAYLIAGHHAGLPDYDLCDGGKGALLIRLEEGSRDLEFIRAPAEAVAASQLPLFVLPPFVKKENFHFWVRMLFSCLVDADFLDTEQFMQPEQARQRCGNASLETLKDALDRHMEGIRSKCGDTPVNHVRQDVLMACRVAARKEPGLFTLTVPTGGGKTLSAMTFALDHAIRYNKRRVVYVIPYTSIIEQTAATLATIFGPDNVVEHHSNLDPEKETLRSRMASENWDAPIVVTTNVQFFESLYSARPSRCRKLHNLVNSVVILDEAQLVPPNLLAPCVAAINELTQNFGVTAVLSTATQPALPNLRTPTEIVPSNLRLYGRLKRTEIFMPDDLDTPTTWGELAACLQMNDQVLCIVNSRRDCYDLYQRMPEGTIHLSALMCGEHRSKVIALIKVRLENGEPLRVVSTQLVEAGVDIDFPVVYRAFAGLDSIAQAAGRCNREGTLKHAGRVVVFIPPKPAPRGLLHKGECTTKELLALPDFDAHAPESHTRYFELFYSKVNDTGDSILRGLTPSDPNVLEVAFRTVGDGFRLIDDGARRPVIVRWGANERLLRQLRYSGPNRILMRRLQRFTVSLHTRVAERMLFDGLLEEVWPGILAQCSLSIYSDETGLDVFREGLPIEDLTGV